MMKSDRFHGHLMFLCSSQFCFSSVSLIISTIQTDTAHFVKKYHIAKLVKSIIVIQCSCFVCFVFCFVFFRLVSCLENNFRSTMLKNENVIIILSSTFDTNNIIFVMLTSFHQIILAMPTSISLGVVCPLYKSKVSSPCKGR